MARLDLHTHSRFFHGFAGRPTWYDRLGARLHVAVARMRGLDGIAVTNHDYYERFDIDTGDLTIIPGIEISSTAGHLLVIGPDPPKRTKPNMLEPAEVVEMARERGCAVVLAHPYRNSRIKETDTDVDAIEVNGKRSTSVALLEELAADRDLPLVGGSDAHYPFEIGRAYTEMDSDPVTPDGVVAAIRNGRVDYRIQEWFPNRQLRRVYGLIHQLKGQIPSLGEQTSERTNQQSVNRTTIVASEMQVRPTVRQRCGRYIHRFDC